MSNQNIKRTPWRAAIPMMAIPMMALIGAAGATTLLGTSGCVYRLAIQQGNFLDPAQVQQLKTGMTRAQVRFLLGTPMLPDGFNRDRWDYIYYLKTGRIKQAIEHRLTVWFQNDKVARFENHGIPAAPAAAPVSATVPAAAAEPAAPTEPAAPAQPTAPKPST